MFVIKVICPETSCLLSSASPRRLLKRSAAAHLKHTCMPSGSKGGEGTNTKMTTAAILERYVGPEPDLQECKAWLSSFKGGSVLLDKDEDSGIAQICLNRPEKKNAMSGIMMVELGEAVKELEMWRKGKGLILRGKGTMFCSGGDLDFARASAGAETAFKMSFFMHNVLSRLKLLPMVSAALIHGQGAVGGGAEISAACDWRLMTSDCRGIGFVHTRMGIVPAWSGSTRLANIVGSRCALDLICSSRILIPFDAHRLGVVDSLVEPGEDGSGLSAALCWMSERTQAEAHVLHAAKSTILQYEQSAGQTLALAEERRIFAPLWGGPANQRALNSRIKHL